MQEGEFLRLNALMGGLGNGDLALKLRILPVAIEGRWVSRSCPSKWCLAATHCNSTQASSNIPSRRRLKTPAAPSLCLELNNYCLPQILTVWSYPHDASTFSAVWLKAMLLTFLEWAWMSWSGSEISWERPSPRFQNLIYPSHAEVAM